MFEIGERQKGKFLYSGNWWFIQVEKQAEILIDKYYSCVKVIHKVVLDIK